jgi:hypothetical protein
LSEQGRGLQIHAPCDIDDARVSLFPERYFHEAPSEDPTGLCAVVEKRASLDIITASLGEFRPTATRRPLAWSKGITLFQPETSAEAPRANTTFFTGFAELL